MVTGCANSNTTKIMEENKFDPLQFIGFLLISAILMFWFYDNQSNIIENQQGAGVENVLDQVEDDSISLNNTEEEKERYKNIFFVKDNKDNIQ